jgi:threonine/homoserine/homoserine lactone efflux protein
MAATILVLGPVVLATVLPGPSMLLAMDHGFRFGFRRAVATALGNVAATALQVALALAGLEAAASGPGRLLPWIRLGGALYLGWLGFRMLREAGRRPGAASADRAPAVPAASGGFGRFRQAALLTLGNPAAYLFFAAFFPRFLGGAGGRAWLVFHLALPILAITFASMLLYARFGQGLVRFLGRPDRARAFHLALGTAFLGLGAWLAGSG